MAKAEKSPLHLALDHAYLACGGSADFARYCHFQPGWLVGYDGLIAVGTRVNEQLPVAPDTELFRAAISRVGNPYSLSVKSDGTSITVSGNQMRVNIKCHPNTAIPNVMPDPPLGPCTDALRVAVCAAAKIVAGKSDASVVGSSVLIREQTAVATDGGTVVEAWHGNGLPLNVLVPKEFADALGKVKAQPTHCGWGQDTFTVWFGPDQWLRTNVYRTQYPDTDILFAQFMAQCTEFRPVPEVMLQAIETLKPFRNGPTMWLMDYGLNSGPNNSGAYFAFEHYLDMPANCEYLTNGLTVAALHAKYMSFCKLGAYWYGDTVRGMTALANEL